MTTRDAFGGVLDGTTVLVTGHTGFKGSWLTLWLDLLGARVIGYSRDPDIEPKQRNHRLCRLDQRMTHIVGDIRDAERVQDVVATHAPQVVLHLAAQPLVNVSYQDPKRTIDTNASGTVNILEAIRKTDCVQVFVGVTTDKVYEDKNWVWGYREDDALGGYDPYSASKSMAELCVQSYRRSWSERWTENGKQQSFSRAPVALATARAGNVIGGGDFSRYRLVPDCMRALLDANPIQLRNPGSIRPWQHVLEPLGGYLWLAAQLLDRDNPALCEAWNFGPPEDDLVTCESIVKEAIGHWGSGSYSSPPEHSEQRHETHSLRLNWVKAATHLKWSPTYSWRQAVRATVDWFKEYGRQGGSSSAAPSEVDMFDFCRGQIGDFVQAGRDAGAPWAGSARTAPPTQRAERPAAAQAADDLDGAAP